MKKISLAALVVSSLISCQTDKLDGIPGEDSLKRELVMEIISHSQSVVQLEFLNKQKHEGFLSAPLLMKIHEDPLAFKMYNQSYEENDTVFDLLELPVFSEINYSTRIYSDGTSSAVILDLTPEDANPADSFKETPPNEEHQIFKTVVENQQLFAYNKAGSLLIKEDFPVENLSDFLDTVKYYVKDLHQKSNTAIAQKMNAYFLQQQKINPGIQSKILSNGNVQFQNKIVDPVYFPEVSDLGDASELKTVSELDPAMSKILKFEMYNGDQLLSRKVFKYSDNPKLQNSVFQKDAYGENPVEIEMEMLITHHNGLPMIRKSREIFIQNQTRFYF